MSEDPWTVNKNLNPSTLLVIIGYAIALVVGYVNLNNDVVSNKERIIRDETRIEILETLVQNQAVAMARIDENIKAIRTMAEHWSKDK